MFRGTLAPKTLTAQIGFTDILLDWLELHASKNLDELAEHGSLWTKFMIDIQQWDSPAAPYLHEFLHRKRFYTIAPRKEMVING
jgi:hypothetical protein